MKIKPADFHYIGSALNWSELLKKRESGKGRKMFEVLCWMHDSSECQIVVKAYKFLFDLWLFLRTWPHTTQAFLETSRQAGHIFAREMDSHNTGNFTPYSLRTVCGFFNVPR